jgi:hypothetical protein
MCAARRAPGVWVIVLCTACARSSAPNDWLPEPRQAQTSAHGGWIEVEYREGDVRRHAVGELIAVSADSIWILSHTGGMVVQTAAAESGKLWAYAPRTGDLNLWTLGGALSTISNGWFLVFTAPVWIIGGGIAAGSETGAARRSSPPRGWTDLSAYARFPQGLPEGVPLAGLRVKRDSVEVVGRR